RDPGPPPTPDATTGRRIATRLALRRPPAGGRRVRHHFFLAGRLQPGIDTCLPRATLSAPGGVSLVMVEPPPMVPPAPSVTGATSTQLLPTCTSASITVRCLLAP